MSPFADLIAGERVVGLWLDRASFYGGTGGRAGLVHADYLPLEILEESLKLGPGPADE